MTAQLDTAGGPYNICGGSTRGMGGGSRLRSRIAIRDHDEQGR